MAFSKTEFPPSCFFDLLTTASVFSSSGKGPAKSHAFLSAFVANGSIPNYFSVGNAVIFVPALLHSLQSFANVTAAWWIAGHHMLLICCNVAFHPGCRECERLISGRCKSLCFRRHSTMYKTSVTG